LLFAIKSSAKVDSLYEIEALLTSMMMICLLFDDHLKCGQ